MSDQINENLPFEIVILPIRIAVAYPLVAIPVEVNLSKSIKLVEQSWRDNRQIGLLTIKDHLIETRKGRQQEFPTSDQIYSTGTLVTIEQIIKVKKNELQVIFQGIEKFDIVEWTGTDPYLRAKIRIRYDEYYEDNEDIEMEALLRSLRDLSKEVVLLAPELPKEVIQIIDSIDSARHLIYFVASISSLTIAEKQKILELDNLKEKCRILLANLAKEKEVVALGKKIQADVKEEIDKTQKEFFLRQELKAIHKELGEKEEDIIGEYTEKINKANMSDEAKKEAIKELERLTTMSPQSAEFPVVKTYLDWIVELPWQIKSNDQIDIENARLILDNDHYDIYDVKDRILEYLAVKKIIKERNIPIDKEAGETATILCFVGPPGVGKTSLGQSIARALGRKFTRMSLGGIRDEAEIRGHRRTYVGALPGRIIQALKRVGTRNPVFMLDEIDKVGVDWRGDPSSALLEVLDPAQNHSFRDNYLDVDFDLSEIMFITTANQLETILPPLRDRMEIIQLDGYTEYEKLIIAIRYLIPRQLKVNGLREHEIIFAEEAIKKIIQDYTREAGVRNLERQIGTVCRKCAIKIASKETSQLVISPEQIRTYLKKEKFESEISESVDIPGIVTGLAVTDSGGEILFIEATYMKGKGELTITGQLGAVMRESAQIAHSYVRSKAAQLGIDPDEFGKTDVHLHVPAGATPKDGPSAGLAMVVAIASLFSNKPINSTIGMTGEATLRGRVLPVGGIKMKSLAAHRAGIKKVILPKRNERDLEELPEDILKSIDFVLVERIDDALSEVFLL